MSADGLISTKEKPGALDGFERAKPDEPIFTLQGGDPIAVRLVKVYIWLRRRAAFKIADDRKREAELLRCSEAERQLWAMEEYLRSGKVDEKDETPHGNLPAEIDLFDYRVRAAQKVSGMACELLEIDEELRRREFIYDSDEAKALVEGLRLLRKELEPRRMMK
jgi:hypothetical protein